LDEVTYERRGAAAWVRINRPDDLNALNQAVVAGLSGALARASRDDEVRAVVLTGNGRAFCAGGDLKALRELAESDPRGSQGFLIDVGETLDAIEAFPKPVVAAVNGLALAGGLEIVLCCDIVVASERAKLGDAHANYGLIPGGGASARLPRKVGPSLASYLLFTGVLLPAGAFLPSGFVTKVVPDEDLTEAVDEIVGQLASKSPLSLARMKQLVHDGLDQPLAAAVRTELIASEAHGKSHDMAEGLAAFSEKRKPHFIGR
jgi:enoyl-CoA hydratase/carnithine racemase